MSKPHRHLILAAGTVLGISLALATPTRANGRFPSTINVHFQPGEPDLIALQVTWGLLISRDAGATFRWACEEAVGFGGIYDPDYAFTSTGLLLATTTSEDGLRLTRDQCTWTPAPPPLGPAMPGGVATFVSEVEVTPDGTILAAASDANDSRIYASTDDGASFAVISEPAAGTDWWEDLLVAPSNGERVYLAGYDLRSDGGKQRILFRSDNGAQAWTPLPVDDFTFGGPLADLQLAAVSPTDPDLVFARVFLANGRSVGDNIYRSTDAGLNWTQVFTSGDNVTAVVVRASGEVVLATQQTGVHISSDGGQTFGAPIMGNTINCVRERNDGVLFVCSLSFPPESMALGHGTVAGSWEPMTTFKEVVEPIQCVPGVPQADVCDAQRWGPVVCQFGIDDPAVECGLPIDAGPAPDAGNGAAPKDGCGSCSSASGPSTGVLFLLAVMVPLARRRRGRILVASLLLLLTAASTTWANGRFPASTSVAMRPGDLDDLYLGATFGLVISHDDGWTWEWLCENSIGYGGTFDPKYAVGADGTIYATTYDGLRVSRDDGCTFETATAEQPAGPNRIADLWVDAIDIGSDGAVWVGTAESGLPNAVLRSTDQARTFTRMGLESKTMWWKSLKVAPSDPQRIYVTGYQVSPSVQIEINRSSDGGQSWEVLPTTEIVLGSTSLVILEAIDPTDPNIVYVRSVGVGAPMVDRIYRTADGGLTWTGVLETGDSIRGVAVRANGDVVVATALDGVYTSTDRGLTFAKPASSPQMTCVAARDNGELFGCGSNWDPDFFTLGRSTDAQSWSKIVRFHELTGPKSCPSGTVQHDVCELQLWPSMREQFAITGRDGGPGPSPDAGTPADGDGGGCCGTGSGGSSAAVLALGVVALLRLRRRPGRVR